MNRQLTLSHDNPGFLVGEGRSGTTLLSSILNRHPDLCVTPETHFFRLVAAYPGGNRGFAHDWPSSLQTIIEQMDPTPDWNPSAKGLLQTLNSNAPEQFPGLKTLFLALGGQIADQRNKPLWLEKTPPHIDQLPLIRSLFPNAPVIHLVRDGRDVAASLARMHWTHGTEISYLLRWQEKVTISRLEVESNPHSIAIRYEDLASDPEQCIKRVCEFLGLDYSPKLLIPDGSEENLIEVGQSHKEQVKQPISTDNIARWRSTYSDEDHRVATVLAGSELTAWGYSLASTLPTSPIEVNITYPLEVERERPQYDTLIRTFCLLSDKLVLGNTELLCDTKRPPPAYWITGEPVPTIRFQKISRIKKFLGSWRILYNLLRMHRTKIIWFYHGEPETTQAWPQRRRIEQRIAKQASVIVCACKSPLQCKSHKIFNVDYQKILHINDGFNTRLAATTGLDVT